MYTIEEGVLNGSSTYFNSPSSISKSLFYYVNSIGHFYCDNNYKVTRDNFDSFLLMYVVTGKGLLTIDNNSQVIKANDIALINCYEPHSYESTSSLETVWLHFDGNLSLEYFNLINQRINNVIFSSNSTLIPDYLNSMINLFKENKILNESIISCNIQRMLAELLILSNGNDNYLNSDYINDSISYIQNNYKNKLSLNELANNICMSPFHFSRVFKRETGYSPYEYITMIRFNHAKILLKTTDLLIKEIAFECGFNSESNFVLAFKKHTNISPSKFRNIPI